MKQGIRKVNDEKILMNDESFRPLMEEIIGKFPNLSVVSVFLCLALPLTELFKLKINEIFNSKIK